MVLTDQLREQAKILREQAERSAHLMSDARTTIREYKETERALKQDIASAATIIEAMMPALTDKNDGVMFTAKRWLEMPIVQQARSKR